VVHERRIANPARAGIVRVRRIANLVPLVPLRGRMERVVYERRITNPAGAGGLEQKIRFQDV
jgi:hypothetical protein